jgi:hypothetical protein
MAALAGLWARAPPLRAFLEGALEGSTFNSGSKAEEDVIRERDRDVRTTNIYLLSKPLEDYPSSNYQHHHWAVLFVFIEGDDIVYRVAELTTTTDPASPRRPVVSYRYYNPNVEWLVEAGYQVLDYGVNGSPCPENPGRLFSLETSPYSVWNAVRNHAMNGTAYRVGLSNCQDYAVQLLRALGITIDPNVIPLSRSPLAAIIQFGNDVSRKKGEKKDSMGSKIKRWSS